MDLLVKVQRGVGGGIKDCTFHPTLNLFPNDKFWTVLNGKRLQTNNFKFCENGRKFSKRVENTVARYEQFLLFPQCFQETYTTDT